MKKTINYYFLGLAFFLLVSGFLFLSTLSAIASLQVFGNTNYYLFRQLTSISIGLVLGLITFKIPLPFLKKVSPILLLVNFIALILVFMPFVGIKLWGASRWVSIGGYSFQPSEFFKITAILYISAWLSNKFSVNSKKNWLIVAKKGYYTFIQTYLPFISVLGVITIILILQRDMSTLGIISITLITMYFMADTPVWQTILTIIGGISAGLILIVSKPYRFERLLTFLHPGTDPLGIGYQVNQAKLAIGSGGIFGKGLGMSVQKFEFLPQAMSDSIFAILGEETGIVGCLILILLFLGFLYLGFKIANLATDKFSKLTAVGISTWIIFQAFINIASNIGLFPLSGIPLPFFSYGGSHIISEIIGVGLLLNISKNG